MTTPIPGYTWPITSSDHRPVQSFKTGLANYLRRMAEDEIRDRRSNVSRIQATAPQGTHAIAASFAREDTLLEVATLCDAIVIEGEG